jgi:hypothetical protein
MNTLLFSLALTAPAHPPAVILPAPLPPGVQRFPQVTPVVPLPAHRPPLVLIPPPPVIVQRPPLVIVPPQPVVPQALTLAEFSRFFTPTPGKHEVWIVHPVTQRPVLVCFVLPGGKLRDLEVDRRCIHFDFGRDEVDIDFRNDGTVRVRYRD